MKRLLAAALVVIVLSATSACGSGEPEATPPQSSSAAQPTQGSPSASETDSATPVEVSGLNSKMASAAAGFQHTCALTTGGDIWCWGRNRLGQLGNGNIQDSATPVEVLGLNGSATALVAGDRHNCALTREGGVKCWGSNSRGQIGDGTPNHKVEAVDVIGLASGVSAIASGTEHVCALTTGGGVTCWGQNGVGQLGDGTTEDRKEPVKVSGLDQRVTAVATSEDHSCAVIATGAVKCWGANDRGQLGNGTTTSSSTPNSTPVEAVVLKDPVVAVAVGPLDTCVLTTAGRVKCWGGNRHGQLGDGTTTDNLVPVDVAGLASGVVTIGLGRSYACVLTKAGAVKCWGANDRGQLGDGTTTDRTAPVGVSGLDSGVVALTVGTSHSCAVASDGGMMCWGRNDVGQLGDGSGGADDGGS